MRSSWRRRTTAQGFVRVDRQRQTSGRVRFLPPSEARTGPASPGRLVCAPGAMTIRFYRGPRSKGRIAMPVASWFGVSRDEGLPKTARNRLKSNRVSLSLEQLEDRCVPAIGLSATLVAYLLPGELSSNPGGFKNVNGTLYFTTRDTENGSALYSSDGTAEGTILIKNGVGGGGFSPLGASIYFADETG